MKPLPDSSSRSLAHAWIHAAPAGPDAQIAWVSALALVVLVIGLVGVRDPASFSFQPASVPPFNEFEIPAPSGEKTPTEMPEAGLADPLPASEWSVPTIPPSDLALPNGGSQLVPITPPATGNGWKGISQLPAGPRLGQPGASPEAERFAEFADGQEAGFFPAPTYPRESRLRGESGTTRLRWTVRASGEVSDIQVVTSSGSAALDQAAVSTLRNRWRFQPGQVRRYERQFEFQLVR